MDVLFMVNKSYFDFRIHRLLVNRFLGDPRRDRSRDHDPGQPVRRVVQAAPLGV